MRNIFLLYCVALAGLCACESEEKVYPDGNYETELVDFYLVNTDTMQVTDEQKNTW